MRRSLLPSVLALLVTALPGCQKNVAGPKIDPAATDRGAVVVLPLHPEGVPLDPNEAKTLTRYLANRLIERGRLRVVPYDEERELLYNEKLKGVRSLRNDDQSKVELGKELAAKTAVTTSIGKLDALCVVTAEMNDLETSVKVQTATAKGPCDQKALLAVLDYVGDRLSGLPAKEPRFEDAAGLPSDRAVPYGKALDRPQTLGEKASTYQPAFSARYYTIGGLVGPDAAGLHVLGLQSLWSFRLGNHVTLGPLARVGFVGDGTSLLDLGLHLGATYSLLSWLDVNWRTTGGYTALDFSASDWNLGTSADLTVFFSDRTGMAAEAALAYYGRQQDLHTNFTISGVWAF